MKNTFTENQKYTQWWIWLIHLGLGLIAVYGIVQQIVLKNPFGTNPMSDTGLILFSILILASFVFFRIITLKTKIDEKGLEIKFFPFANKYFEWTEIRTAQVLEYKFVGYGIRFSRHYGTVYNVKGNKGLAIELTSGKKILIGTQKEVELRNIMEKASR